MANILYRKQKQQKSLDNGVTWIDTGEYRVGAVLENPSNCSGTDTKQCRWVDLDASEGYYCDGYKKYTVQVEECTENGVIWTRTGNQRKGNTYVEDSMDCVNELKECEVLVVQNCDWMYFVPGEVVDCFDYEDAYDCDDTYIETYLTDELVISDTYRRKMELYNTSCLKHLSINGPTVYTTNLSEIDMSNLEYLRLMLNNLKGSLTLSNWGNKLEYFQIKCENLQELIITNFNHPNLKSLAFSFANNNSLCELNVTNMNTSNVEEFSYCFENCGSLMKITGIETFVQKNSELSSMFLRCENLRGYLDLSRWKFGGASLREMFSGCQNITSINLSGWDVTKLGKGNLYAFTSGCISLKEIDISGWDLSNYDTGYTEHNSVFPATIERIIVTNCNTATINKLKTILNYCGISESKLVQNQSLQHTDVYTYVKDKSTEFEYEIGVIDRRPTNIYISVNEYFINTNGTHFCIDSNNYCSGKIPINNILNYKTSYSYSGDWYFKSVNKLPTMDYMTDFSRMFNYYSFTEYINATDLVTSNVTDMSYMFSMCSALTTVNISNFSTSNVTDMSYMFKYCCNLPSLNVSSFNTSKVTNMSSMFSDCGKLKTLDLSNFDVSNVTNFDNMFKFTSELETLNLSGWDINPKASFTNMFQGSGVKTIIMNNCSCTSIPLIKTILENANLFNVEIVYDSCIDASGSTSGNTSGGTLSFTFSGDSYVYLINNNHTINGGTEYTATTSPYTVTLSELGEYFFTEASNMFRPKGSGVTYGLLTVDSMFDMSLCKDTWGMFQYCLDLTYINLANCNFTFNVNSSYVFRGCRNLKTIDLTGAIYGDYYLTIDATTNPFDGCYSLEKIILGEVTEENYNWIYNLLVYENLQDDVTIEYTIKE